MFQAIIPKFNIAYLILCTSFVKWVQYVFYMYVKN
jgi:hypothetical protein